MKIIINSKKGWMGNKKGCELDLQKHVAQRLVDHKIAIIPTAAKKAA